MARNDMTKILAAAGPISQSTFGRDLTLELATVSWVESAGRIYWKVKGQNRPAIRFEGHYFYRILRRKSKAKFQQAVKLGLAHPSAGRVKNPNSYAARYSLLARAMRIDAAAALESISMGIGQVMGSHWKRLGYPSVQAMWDRASSGLGGQMELMARYVKRFGLVDELVRHDWAGFALGYNGKNYRKNNYDGKMKRTYARLIREGHKGKIDGGSVIDAADAKALKILKSLGYDTSNKFRAIKQFQKNNGLVVDGDVGPMTWKALQAEQAQMQSREAKAMQDTGVVAASGGATGQLVVEKAQEMSYMSGVSDWLQYAVIAAIIVGLGMIVWSWWKRRRLPTDVHDPEVDVSLEVADDGFSYPYDSDPFDQDEFFEDSEPYLEEELLETFEEEDEFAPYINEDRYVGPDLEPLEDSSWAS